MITERLTGRVLLLPSLCLFLSILIRVFLGLSYMTAFVSVSSVLLLIICKGRDKAMFSCFLAILLMAYSCCYLAAYRGHETPDIGRNLSFECKIHSVEKTLDGVSRIRAYSSEFGFLEFKSVEGFEPVAGEWISCEGYFFEPDVPRDPGQFDYKSYLARKGVEHAFKPDFLSTVKPASILNRFLDLIEERSFDLRCEIIDMYGEYGPLASSVFLGDSSLIEDSERALFKRNGCAHILAVSGTHFAGFLALLTYFLDKGRKNNRKRALYVIFCVILASLTGWSSSVTRSCVMCSSSYCSKDPLSGLCTACIVMMVADPYCAVSYGFLMTSCASMAIIYLTPLINLRLKPYLGKKMTTVIAPVTASQIGMMPFISLTSQRFGVIPALVQITTSFIASSACSFFVPSAILAKCFLPVFIFPSEAMLVLLMKFIRIADKFYAGFSLGNFTGAVVILLAITILCDPSVIAKKLKKPLLLLLLVSLCFSVADKISSPNATAVFIDVGQGDSCLIMAAGKTVLIDGGTYDAGKDNVVPVLEYHDIRHIDVTIATHWDSDHLGGLIYLYQQGITGKIYTSFVKSEPKQLQVMDEYLEGFDVTDVFESMNEGDIISLDDNCTLQVIYPSSDEVSDGENEDSLVIRLICYGTTMLFTGDLGIESEDKLLDRYDIGNVDILKAGHHGSEFSTGNRLLDEISPDICIISAGVGNQYGHPSEKTLGRLRKHDTEVISTQDYGAITIDIYADRYTISGFLIGHGKYVDVVYN